jgi:DNA modification methylase
MAKNKSINSYAIYFIYFEKKFKKLNGIKKEKIKANIGKRKCVIIAEKMDLQI